MDTDKPLEPTPSETPPAEPVTKEQPTQEAPADPRPAEEATTPAVEAVTPAPPPEPDPQPEASPTPAEPIAPPSEPAAVTEPPQPQASAPAEPTPPAPTPPPEPVPSNSPPVGNFPPAVLALTDHELKLAAQLYLQKHQTTIAQKGVAARQATMQHNLDRIEKYIRQQGDTKLYRIAKVTSLAPGTVSKHLVMLVKQKRITATGHGTTRRYYKA